MVKEFFLKEELNLGNYIGVLKKGDKVLSVDEQTDETMRLVKTTDNKLVFLAKDVLEPMDDEN